MCGVRCAECGVRCDSALTRSHGISHLAPRTPHPRTPHPRTPHPRTPHSALVPRTTHLAPRTMSYIELHTASAFSFLQGASLPEALVERAAALGYEALALLDADGVYGAPRFHKAAEKAGIKAIIGAELTIAPAGVNPASATAD